MPEHQINEEDLEVLFGGKKEKKPKKLPPFIYFIISFIVIFALVFAISNFESVKKQFSWWYQNDYKAEPDKTEKYAKIIETSNLNETISESLPRITPNHILIPKISVDAPVNWQVKNDPDITAKELESGVIHLAGTALPGQNGNVFITGHSSNYIWAKGNYKTIFSLLDKLVVGDVIFINYNNKIFAYKVKSLRITKPTDLSLLDESPSPILTLVTCTPVGTSINRLAVIADQIYPNPTSNSNATVNENNPNSIPQTR